MNENEIGSKLVNILYENSNTNYDICAENLIKVFSFLERNVEKLDSKNFKLILESIKDSITDPNKNPDLKLLEEHFNYLNDIKEELKSGNSSYLDFEDKLENVIYKIQDILGNRSSLKTFSKYFSSNREFSFTLYEIWKLSTNNILKCSLIQLLTIIFHSDNALVEILYLNTNLLVDLCFILKEQIKLRDFDGIYSSLICLCYFFTNISTEIPKEVVERLKKMNLIEDIFDLIEENDEFVYKNVTEHKFCSYLLDTNKCETTLLNHLILFILSLNSKFSLPEENFILQYLINSESNSKDFSVFSENLVSLFNSENDPLSYYKFSNAITAEPNLYNNCLIKMVSDLFSSKKTINTTSIFYLNDFKVLIDVIIRKLSNLTANDQIRSDYLSLIHLVIKNSSYIQQMYKIDELLICFNMILNERDQYTIDQDIVRIILSENPELLNQ